MKYRNQKQYILTKAASLLIALTLCVSLAIPAGGFTAYAASETAASEAEATEKETEESAVPAETEEAKEPAAPTETAIKGYKTSYNKRYNEVLEIEADITPAGDREVQLQRYSSEDGTWATILTVNEENAVEPVAEEDAADAGTEDAADAVVEEGAAEAVAEEGTSETATEAGLAEIASEEGTADAATEEAPAETVAKDAVVDGDTLHVRFDVPAEERARTSSKWRLYVPATEKATEAYSKTISVTTRNIEKYSLSARNACVYRIDEDGSGTMIYSKESKTEVAQASTTKLMTAILLLESGLIDTTTVISPHAANTPWGSGRLAAGDVYNTRDLLYAMLLPSSNDAATAVAERVGGSEGAFVQRMNAKAEKMGLTQTHFCNPHGLDADGHYTTALELAKLTAYAYTFPEIRDCWETQWKTIRSLKYGKKWTLWSTNSIFGYISGFIGGKTGTEDNAGCCFTGVYEYDGVAYVTVVLGSGYGFSRWADTKKLHSYVRNYAESSY